MVKPSFLLWQQLQFFHSFGNTYHGRIFNLIDFVTTWRLEETLLLIELILNMVV